MIKAAKVWRREKRAAYLYRVLSDAESGSPRQLLFLELAQDADARAVQAAQTGQFTPEKYAPDRLTRLTVKLLEKIGPHLMRPWMGAMGLEGLSVFISGRPVIAGETFWNRQPAVFMAAHEGLLFITLLVVLMAGATGEPGAILLTGVAGLLLGALTLAVGTYFAVRSQRRVVEHRRLAGPDDLTFYPQAETRELALVYQARGLSGREALTQAKQRIAELEFENEENPSPAPLLPAEPGKPRAVAMQSFFAFLLGGTLPLLPYLLGISHYPLLAGVALSAAGLFLTGMWLSWHQGREALWGGFRMLAWAAGAGLMIYWIGRLLGGSF